MGNTKAFGYGHIVVDGGVGAVVELDGFADITLAGVGLVPFVPAYGYRRAVVRFPADLAVTNHARWYRLHVRVKVVGLNVGLRWGGWRWWCLGGRWLVGTRCCCWCGGAGGFRWANVYRGIAFFSFALSLVCFGVGTLAGSL